MNEEEYVSYFAIIPANVRYDPDLPPNAKLLYGEITALCNKEGYCWASNNYFAGLYSVSKISVSNWISALIKKGYITSEIIRNPENKSVQERRLRIAISIDRAVDPIKENNDTLLKKSLIPYTKKFEYPIKENFKENNTSNNTSNNKKYNKKISADAETVRSDFELLWSLYPNKKGSKPAAFKSYQKAIKNGVTNEVIEQGIKNLIADIRANKTEIRFVPHGSTWFNQERWNDSYQKNNSKPDYDNGGENILETLEEFI